MFFTPRPSPSVLPCSSPDNHQNQQAWSSPCLWAPAGRSPLFKMSSLCPSLFLQDLPQVLCLHDISLELPNQSPLNALLYPCSAFCLQLAIGPGMFHGKAVWKILCRKGVLEKAAYLMPIHTVPSHPSNFKGSEKFCNAETC